MSGDDSMMFDNFYPFFGFWMLAILVMLIIALLVANDAARYGENGFLWGFVVFIMPMMGLLIYAVIRSGWNFRAPAQPVATQPTPRPAYVAPPIQTPAAMSNSIYCTICGYENPKSAAYCNKCGSKIPAGA